MSEAHPSRREWLRRATLAGLSVAAAGASGCESPTRASRSEEDQSAPPIEAAQPATMLHGELFEQTFEQLQARMGTGQLTARALVGAYVERIEAVNGQGPKLRAVIEVNPEAERLASERDDERRAGRVRGPLHGIPILLKDNIDTADAMTTTAGSLALEGLRAVTDATVAARLREAGAILLGKANMSEWANFRSTASSSGWSARGGQCRNPYVLDRSPSGSSSGSASGVAANLAAGAIGTETDGSIVSPASHCALVGLKPTLGLVSRAGIVPIAHSQDTAGPMTRTVRDAAILLQVIAGADGRDPATKDAAAVSLADLVDGLSADALRGVRLGVVRAGIFGKSRKVDRLVDTALEDLRRLGATLVDPADIFTWGQFDSSELDVLLYEFKADLEAYLATRGAEVRVRTLGDVIAFNVANAERELRYFGQELFEMSARRGPLTEGTYLQALERNRRLAGPEGIDAALTQHRVEALVCPTGSLPGPIDLVNGDSGYFGASTPAAVAGYPHVTVPAGFVQGLPVGLSFIGPRWADARILRYAFAYEHATRHRQPPRFLSSIDDRGV